MLVHTRTYWYKPVRSDFKIKSKKCIHGLEPVIFCMLFACSTTALHCKRTVLNRLRPGGRRPGGPGSDYARYLCSPPSDRSPTQDPPALPCASQKDTAGSQGYNLWITRQIVHRQPAPLYSKITGSRHRATGPRKGVNQAEMIWSTMLAILD